MPSDLCQQPGSTSMIKPAGGVGDSAKVQTWSNTPVYSFALADYVPVATPTDILVIQGSATKTIKIQSISITTEGATAVGIMKASLVRRSTAGTLGSAALTPVTAGYHDTTDAAATAIVSSVGTANYTTLGTAAGNLGAKTLPFNVTGQLGEIQWNFESLGIKPIVLRGVTDFLCINLNGDALPAGAPKIYFDIRIEEDIS